jgi:acyl CoA:acetate/3-ketoacid CoA transferase beta subunit
VSNGVVEGWMPYRTVFDTVWSGRRHVMMGASQIDRFGNQNISCIGDHARPRAQLVGMRGAPGNTINHPTSYFIPGHSTRVFVAKVDVVCGVGYDRAAALGPGGRFHGLRRVVTNLAVLDFESPDHAMRLVSCHPSVSVADVVTATGFPLVVPEHVETTRTPTAEELRLLREVIDPQGTAARELAR